MGSEEQCEVLEGEGRRCRDSDSFEQVGVRRTQPLAADESASGKRSFVALEIVDDQVDDIERKHAWDKFGDDPRATTAESKAWIGYSREGECTQLARH